MGNTQPCIWRDKQVEGEFAGIGYIEGMIAHRISTTVDMRHQTV